jgi:putative FmdB family regulatory protein
MPTYEYACATCGHQWEEVQKITAPATEVCPKCTKASAHRLISGGTNFILKGGGWYSDLYASPTANKEPEKSEKSDADGAAAASDASGKSPEKSGSSGEAKAETKTEKSPSASAPSTATSTG